MAAFDSLLASEADIGEHTIEYTTELAQYAALSPPVSVTTAGTFKVKVNCPASLSVSLT